jgi:Putative peptidoglycan binding domain
MPTQHKVNQGECVFSIAFDHGFYPDTIWTHPDNSELRSRRQDASELLAGDIVKIPNKRVAEIQVGTNHRYRFRRNGVPKLLRTRFLRMDKPIAQHPIAVRVDNQPEQICKTNDEGWLVCPIAPNAKAVLLRMKDGSEYRLKLGHMDPINTVSGIQGRLKALGFYSGSTDGVRSDETVRAIKDFQFSENLTVTGDDDEDTQSRLKQLTEG